MARRSGGGITGKNVTQRPVKYGDRATKYNVKGVSQVGQALGNKATDHSRLFSPVERVRDGALGPLGSVPLGNQRSAELSGGNCGPGRGREVMRSGTQGQHGPVSGGPKQAGRDILGAFGVDVPGRK